MAPGVFIRFRPALSRAWSRVEAGKKKVIYRLGVHSLEREHRSSLQKVH